MSELSEHTTEDQKMISAVGSDSFIRTLWYF